MKKKVHVSLFLPGHARFRLGRRCYKLIYSFPLILIPVTLVASQKARTFPQPIPEETNVSGGMVFKVPPTWNRYHTPWFYPPVKHLKTPKQSNHRYLYSSTRIMTSDGIGHSMGVINFEYNMALRLNLTYTHRVGFYSSLSMKQRYAVEEFFGWGYNEVQRKQVQEDGCEPRNGTWPADDNLYDCHFCQTPKKNGKMRIKSVVNLPSVFGHSSCHSSSCRDTQSSFVRKHRHGNTIFQLNGDSCKPLVTDSNMLETKYLFYHKYWNRHGTLLWPNTGTSSNKTRKLRFDPADFNIAIHVRRGDFLEAETRKKRTVTTELVFANVLRRALSIVFRTEGSFSNMPIALHIYSEGKLLRDKVFSTHDVGEQDKAYYDSNGIQRDERWWKSLLKKCFRTGNDKTLRNITRRIRIYLHISEDTIESLHEMIAADMFIGSASGLSANLVWSTSRGIVLIPHHGSIDNERGKKGNVCCSVPFENDSGNFPEEVFETYWKAYVAANDENASRWWLLAQRKGSAWDT